MGDSAKIVEKDWKEERKSDVSLRVEQTDQPDMLSYPVEVNCISAY